MDYSPPGSSIHGDFPGKNNGVGCHALLQGNVSNPGIKPRSLTLQVDSLASELPGNVIKKMEHVVLKVKVLVTQLCLTLFDPMDCSHQAPLSMGFSSRNTGVGSVLQC